MTGIIKTDKIQSPAGNDAVTIASNGSMTVAAHLHTSNITGTTGSNIALDSSIGANSTTAFAAMDGRISYSNDYSNIPRGPNKVLLQNDGNWISGLGISANSLDIYSGGDVKFNKSTSPTAYTKQVTILSGGGIAFNNDTAAANALDDYEEGTWTPAMTTANAHHSQVGLYTKIGRMVSLQMIIDFTQGGSSHGQISGLPFTPAGPSRITFTFREWYSTGITMSSNIVQGSTTTNTIVNYNNSGSSTNNQRYGFAMNCTYQVA